MLEILSQLPLKEQGNADQVGQPQYRCDLLASGHLSLSPNDNYRYNNEFRQEQACVLQITLAGQGYFQSATQGRTELHAGDCFIVDLPSTTNYFIGNHAWEFLYLYYSGELAYHHSQHIIQHHKNYCFHLDAVPLLEPAIQNMFQLIHADSCNSRMISSALYACLMAAYPDVDPNSQLGGVERARQFIDSNFHDANLSIQHIAHAADLSRYHFSRLFKQTYDISPYEYLSNKRMDQAKELLLTTQLPSAQIAQRVGFSDYPYFCNVFKKHVGMTPKQYRTAIHGQ